MRINQKKYFLISLVAILILVCGISYSKFLRQSTTQPSQKDGLNSEIKSEIVNPTKLSQKEGVNTENALQTVPKALSGESLQVSLTVLDKSYKLNIKEGVTLYEAMQGLQDNKENNFIFSGKEFASLGFFVNEINGVKESAGKYWLYYVNGKEAPVGVSKYILKSGDIISWKQE